MRMATGALIVCVFLGGCASTNLYRSEEARVFLWSLEYGDRSLRRSGRAKKSPFSKIGSHQKPN